MVHGIDGGGSAPCLLLAHISRLPLPAGYTPRHDRWSLRWTDRRATLSRGSQIQFLKGKKLNDALQIGVAHLFVFCE